MSIPRRLRVAATQTREGPYESSEADASHLLLPAQPTIEVGLVLARQIDTATDGVFWLMLGTDAEQALANSAGWIPLLTSVLVTGITAGTIISYIFLLLRSLGASALTMGLAPAIATVSELVALSTAGGVIGRLGIGKTILLGAVAGGIRLLIYGLAPSVGWVLATKLLHSITLSMPLSAGVIAAAKLSPKGLGTTGQSDFSAVFFGLGPTIGILMAGYLLNRGSEQAMMTTMGTVVLAGAALVAVPLLRTKNL
jgi:MFS family permease